MAYQISKITLGLVALMGSGALAAPLPAPTGGKSGISYNDVSAANAYPGGSWGYNWNSKSGGLQGKTFVPMLHDNSPARLASWASDTQGADSCLAFNEPDQSIGGGGSQMDAGTAASVYKSTFEKGGCKSLGAPAVSSQQSAGMSTNWLSAFMGACSDCKIDFIPLHVYVQPGQLSWFQNYVKQVHDMFKKPIWVNEFSIAPGSGSDQQNADFISQASQWMDQQDYVQKYSPMKGGSPSTEMNAGSVVGQAYKSA